MTTTRIPTAYVRTALAAALRRDLKQAAGTDRALQTHEREALRVPLAKAAALTIDDTDLPVEDVVQRGVSLADAAWAQTNQATGPGRAFLSQAELRVIAKGDPDIASATAAAVDVVRGTQDAAHLRVVVDESVRNTFGAVGAVEITASRVYGGALLVDVRAANGSARLTLGRDDAGKRAVVDAKLVERPTVLDPELSSSFATTLATPAGGGLVRPVVRAIGHAGEGYALVVAHGASGARTDAALRLTWKADGTVTRTPFAFDDAAAREQAAQLAVQASLDQAAQAQGSGARLSTLEVFLKRDALDPTTFAVVDVADSPVGFDPAREVQYLVPALLGDLAVFVTVDKTSGSMRAETFN